MREINKPSEIRGLLDGLVQQGDVKVTIYIDDRYSNYGILDLMRVGDQVAYRVTKATGVQPNMFPFVAQAVRKIEETDGGDIKIYLQPAFSEEEQARRRRWLGTEGP